MPKTNNMLYEDRYKDFEQYLASGEPGVEERARNWSMAKKFEIRNSTAEFLISQIDGKENGV